MGAASPLPNGYRNIIIIILPPLKAVDDHLLAFLRGLDLRERSLVSYGPEAVDGHFLV